jgi:broad specificity phosphatase PhoE
MPRLFLLFANLTTLVIVQGLSQFSSSSRLSATAGGAAAEWSEADLLKEKALMNSGDDDTPPMPRNFHITAELLDPKSSFSNMDELLLPKNGSAKNDAKTVVATKIVHFQRHGQGYHNLLGDVLREVGVRPDIFSSDPSINPWIRPEIVDSPLTELGKCQCKGQREVASLLKPEVVVVSPLLRAVQTAKLSFADYHVTSDNISGNTIPWIAHEGCREETGYLVCNKRRKLSEIKADFPELQFPPDMTEDDTMFTPSEFESERHKGDRIYDFLVNFLAERSERNIAVVCHSAWLAQMCNDVIDCGGDENLTSWFNVSEIRSMRLTFMKTDATEYSA